MRLIGGKGSPEEPRLPPGFGPARSDSDVPFLRCPHGRWSPASALAAPLDARGLHGRL
jgi:hypothetical protein